MNWVESLKERVNYRLNICKSCPEYKAATKQCRSCGCFLPAKASISFMECPLKRW